MRRGNLLIYIHRRDLRVSDNPIYHHLATTSGHGFTHMLPLFSIAPNQVEVSGFLKDGETSPYARAISRHSKIWRCGPHRAKFLGESVWNLKDNLEKVGSGLAIRAGKPDDVIKNLIEHFKDKGPRVAAVWTTQEPSHEEIQEQKALAQVCSDNQVEFKLWEDEKYFVDDRDTGLEDPASLPDVFTDYRKTQEPLREKPRAVLPRPMMSSLPPLPDASVMPSQQHPFVMAESLDEFVSRLQKPLTNILENPPPLPEGAVSAHSFSGGEDSAHDRLHHLITSGSITDYKDTRNGLLGQDYSTKLGAFLSFGCITARQVHQEMLNLEDGSDDRYSQAKGYGQGENAGTAAVRFELLWRDYMRLSTRKFGVKLFQVEGFRQDRENRGNYKTWLTANEDQAELDQDPPPEEVAETLKRFYEGTTGMGLIDASQRELYHTGYTSNRARQNVASFLSKHLRIDWRYGAEWYEMMLIDYDVSSNWANWQYLAGVGNDPRSDDRIFNPVKQAFDYDKDGSYVRTWIPELQGLQKLQNLFQVCTASKDDLIAAGITHELAMFAQPLKVIQFEVNYKARNHRGGNRNWRGATSRRGEHSGNGGRAGNRSFGSQRNGGHNAPHTNHQNHNTHNTQVDHRSKNSLVVNGNSPPPPPYTTGGNQNRGYQNGRESEINGSADTNRSVVRESHTSNIHVHLNGFSRNPPDMVNGVGPSNPNYQNSGFQNLGFQTGPYVQQQSQLQMLQAPMLQGPGLQPQPYYFQPYQPQQYQPHAYQSYQPQYMPQSYHPPGFQPQTMPFVGYPQGGYPPFGHHVANHQGYQSPYHPLSYQGFNPQGNPSSGQPERLNSQQGNANQGDRPFTGGWGGLRRPGEQRVREAVVWGQTNGTQTNGMQTNGTRTNGTRTNGIGSTTASNHQTLPSGLISIPLYFGDVRNEGSAESLLTPRQQSRSQLHQERGPESVVGGQINGTNGINGDGLYSSGSFPNVPTTRRHMPRFRDVSDAGSVEFAITDRPGSASSMSSVNGDTPAMSIEDEDPENQEDDDMDNPEDDESDGSDTTPPAAVIVTSGAPRAVIVTSGGPVGNPATSP